MILKRKVKYCKRCDRTLSITKFSKNKNTNDGLQSCCKECIHDLYEINKPQRLLSMRDYRFKNPISTWCSMSRKSHKNCGYIVTITNEQLFDYISTHSHCELCGKKLDFTPFKGQATKDSPSLDRKYNEKEIRIDNIMMLCQDCNRKKGDMPFNEYVKYCYKIWNKFKGEL